MSSHATPDQDPLQVAQAWLRDGRRVALATVVQTWGSSPRPVGSRLVVDQDGHMLGSVSGGCVEQAVMFEAQDAIASGKAKRLSFGVSDEMAWEVGLTCGGQLDVYVEPVFGVDSAESAAIKTGTN
jgi:xanthine dehydrogenase accessory factor